MNQSALPEISAVPLAAPESLQAAPPGAWFFGSPPQVQGPIPLETLRNLIRAQRLTMATPVWSPGMPTFAPAGAIPAIANLSDEAAIGLLVPVGPQSAKAIVAGYLGLFGLIVWPLGPFGVLVGILSLGDLKAHPEKKGHGRAWTGIVLGALESLLLVWLVVRAAS